MFFVVARSDEVAACGWIQDWTPFRRRLGCIVDDATMPGLYWTSPRHRGKGLYRKLLLHSLYLADKTRPIVVYTTPTNVASQRGIRRAGFRFIGCYNVRQYFRFFTRCIPRPQECRDTGTAL